MIKLKTLLTESRDPMVDYTIKLADFTLKHSFPKLYNMCKKYPQGKNDIHQKYSGINYECNINENNKNWIFEYIVIYNMQTNEIEMSLLLRMEKSHPNYIPIGYKKYKFVIYEEYSFVPTGNHYEDEDEINTVFKRHNEYRANKDNTEILHLFMNNKLKEVENTIVYDN